jgi:hypothetical protein
MPHKYQKGTLIRRNQRQGKIMRELKRKRIPILQGYQIYHNCIRPHEASNDKTPSEACGITIEGKNK